MTPAKSEFFRLGRRLFACVCSFSVLERTNAAARPAPHRHQTPRIVHPRVLAARGRMASLGQTPKGDRKPGRGVPPLHLRGDRQGRGAGPERNLPSPGRKSPTAAAAGKKATRQAAGAIRSGALAGPPPTRRPRGPAPAAARRRRSAAAAPRAPKAAATAAPVAAALPSRRQTAAQAATAAPDARPFKKCPNEAYEDPRPFRCDNVILWSRRWRTPIVTARAFG